MWNGKRPFSRNSIPSLEKRHQDMKDPRLGGGIVEKRKSMLHNRTRCTAKRGKGMCLSCSPSGTGSEREKGGSWGKKFCEKERCGLITPGGGGESLFLKGHPGTGLSPKTEEKATEGLTCQKGHQKSGPRRGGKIGAGKRRLSKRGSAIKKGGPGLLEGFSFRGARSSNGASSWGESKKGQGNCTLTRGGGKKSPQKSCHHFRGGRIS